MADKKKEKCVECAMVGWHLTICSKASKDDASTERLTLGERLAGSR